MILRLSEGFGDTYAHRAIAEMRGSSRIEKENGRNGLP